MNLQTIQTFHNTIEANLWKGRLESAGFLCFLYDEHLTSMYPGSNAVLVGGIKLKVRVEDVDRVKEVFPGLLLTGAEDLVMCPKCGSTEVVLVTKSSNYFYVLFEAFRTFADLLFPQKVKHKFKCETCGSNFKN